jgi:AcrR family transcriptional regulator
MPPMTVPLPAGFELAWGITPAPGRRGPKPAHTVDQIVGTAVRLADEQGFAAASLPKIAKALGITANALYRYVNSKEELLVLLAEAGWGPPPAPLTRAQPWRQACAAWVHAIGERYRTHPWLLDMPVRGAPSTPNVLHWLEALLASLTGTGLGNHDMLGCVILLEGYARRMATLTRDINESSATPVQSAAVAEFLQPRLNHRFPLVAAIMLAGDYRDEEDTTELKDDIEFGLARILDGIDVLISQRKAPAW